MWDNLRVDTLLFLLHRSKDVVSQDCAWLWSHNTCSIGNFPNIYAFSVTQITALDFGLPPAKQQTYQSDEEMLLIKIKGRPFRFLSNPSLIQVLTNQSLPLAQHTHKRWEHFGWILGINTPLLDLSPWPWDENCETVPSYFGSLLAMTLTE